jgi:hypothetical protein
MRLQLLAQMLGGTLPATLRVAGASDVADVVRAVQPRDGDQAAQAECLAGVCGFPGLCGACCFWAGEDAKGGHHGR